MDELNILQLLIEKGSNLSNIAELFLFYNLLKRFSSQNQKVEKIEEKTELTMEEMKKNTQIIKYELEQTNRLLATICGEIESSRSRFNK